MIINATYVVLSAALYAAGVYLLLERSLTRVLLGVLVLGNATNLLLLSAGGPAGVAPINSGEVRPEDMSDPLAQAMILTAIVITLGMAAFLLSLIHRAWQLGQQARDAELDVEEVSDDVVDDEEDVRIALLAAEDDVSGGQDDFEGPDDDLSEHTRRHPGTRPGSDT
jgi:multicomponent Na+:H+ antiporter subunit C